MINSAATNENSSQTSIDEIASSANQKMNPTATLEQCVRDKLVRRLRNAAKQSSWERTLHGLELAVLAKLLHPTRNLWSKISCKGH
jgi:hypothetical protein